MASFAIYPFMKAKSQHVVVGLYSQAHSQSAPPGVVGVGSMKGFRDGGRSEVVVSFNIVPSSHASHYHSSEQLR